MTQLINYRFGPQSNWKGVGTKKQHKTTHLSSPCDATVERSTNNKKGYCGENQGKGVRADGSNSGPKARQPNGSAHQGYRGRGTCSWRPRSSNVTTPPPVSPDPSPFGIGLTDSDRAKAIAQWNRPLNRFAYQGHRCKSTKQRRPHASNITTSAPVLLGPSPLGIGLTDGDRVRAVAQWNLTPGNIEVQEAMERERNRAMRLAREAREAATGIKEPPPAQPSLVESFKKMGVQSNQGETASRARMAGETRGLEQEA